MAACLTRGGAYREALACIDAVVDLEGSAPLGHLDAPWHYHSREPVTWPRQQALLSLMRGECRLALGDREGGEAALADGARRAAASDMPPTFGLTLGTHDPFQGSVEDHRLLALTRAACAQRLFFEGSDPSPSRKPKKPKKPAPPDPALLARARAYLDDALAVVGPRAAEDYAGLVPDATFQHPAITAAQKARSWQRRTYFESALVYERMGDLDRARLHLGRAKWIAALIEPTHHYEPELREAVARLGATSTPLA